MTLVLLDTNIYLRLAKRIRPLLGTSFGDENYEVTILRDTENEVHRNATLQFYYPWFDDPPLVQERLARQIRFNHSDKEKIELTLDVLQGHVRSDLDRYLTGGRSPPSRPDCRLLAVGQVRSGIIVTDDLGMHLLASDFEITVWHGYELIRELRAANLISDDLIREIYQALEANGDSTVTWNNAKHTVFSDIFGPP